MANVIEKIKTEYLKICIKLHLYWLEFMDKLNFKKEN